MHLLDEKNRHHSGSIYCIAWNANNRVIATGSNDKSIQLQLFDTETCLFASTPPIQLKHHRGIVRTLDCSSTQEDVLVSGGTGDFLLRVWNFDQEPNEPIMSLDGHTNSICAMQLAKTSDSIISGGMDATIRLWDLRSGCCEKIITKNSSALQSIRYVPQKGTKKQ